MDSRPQPPQKAHNKDGTSVSSRDIQDFDAMEDRQIGKGSTLRFGGLEGKVPGIEFSPQPTTSHVDPLNWSRTRKELAFASLMLATATIGSLKTMFVTVNSVIATELNVSYISAAALTGAPLILGALAGIKSQILSQSVGKRGIYLVSAVMMLLAVLWNMHVTTSYAEFMISRIFQGIGWGAFEALVAESIADIFFVHERIARTNAYNIVNILFTWGTPILGGYLSQSTESFRNQIMVINIIQALAIAFLIFCHPETTFDRSSNSVLPAENTPSKGAFKLYLTTLKLKTQHSTRAFSITRALQPLRALYAPSTLLTTLLSAPLIATTFGIAQSLSLIFTSMPIFLFPSRLGFLFILPLVFSLLTYSVTSTVVYFRTKAPYHLSSSSSNITLGAAVPGLLLSIAGLLSLGLYTEGALMPKIEEESQGSVLALLSGTNISLKTVSTLFGILVSGSVILSYSLSTHLAPSSSPTPARAALLVGGMRFWEEILKGIWCMGMPIWVQGAMQDGTTMVMGFKETAIALAVLSLVLGSSVGAVLWVKGKEIRGVDKRVLGSVEEVGRVKRAQFRGRDSFMDV